MKKTVQTNTLLEFRAELLKERIYATFILLALLLTVDPIHDTPLKVMLMLGGTTLSLWAASIVASRMSQRIVMQKIEMSQIKLNRQLAQHRPLLYAAVFPLFLVTIAFFAIIPLVWAVNIALLSLLLLLIAWSLLSAKAMKAGRFATLVLTGVELFIAIIIIGLKLLASH